MARTSRRTSPAFADRLAIRADEGVGSTTIAIWLMGLLDVGTLLRVARLPS
jgi:hypothetical protein